MPIGTSTGKTYDDQFEQVADMHGLLPTDPNATPKEGQTVARPVISTSQAAKDIVSGAQETFLPSLTPMSDEESTRRLRAFQDAKPGDKVPELEKPGLMSAAAGATDAVSMLPVGGASVASKAMFLGIGGMKRLLGSEVLERTLNRAERIIGESGFDKAAAHELSIKTGLTIGTDDLLRYEIPSHRSQILEKNLIPGPNNTLSPKMGNTVGDILHHPELFKAYPELAKIPVYPLDPKHEGKYLGMINSDGIQVAAMDADKLRDTLLHELQHAIQNKEGFAYGGTLENTKDRDTYSRLAGEVEARNVTTRRDLGLLERARILPETTEDTYRSEQIVNTPQSEKRKLIEKYLDNLK